MYKEPDNPCPMNYAPYKKGCYMGVKTRRDYDGAVTTCATVGGIITPMKNPGIFEFLKAFANAEGINLLYVSISTLENVLHYLIKIVFK